MTYSVVITQKAELDLRGIYEYIAYVLQSAQNAAAQLTRLEENILSLKQMPERYRCYEKEPWHSRGLRIMTVDHYCVFYIPDHDKETVYIIRILYGGRDIDKVLAKD